MYGILEVKADSLEDAIQKALGPEYPLPTNNAYVEDTFKVDFEVVENYNEEMPFA